MKFNCWTQTIDHIEWVVPKTNEIVCFPLRKVRSNAWTFICSLLFNETIANNKFKLMTRLLPINGHLIYYSNAYPFRDLNIFFEFIIFYFVLPIWIIYQTNDVNWLKMIFFFKINGKEIYARGIDQTSCVCHIRIIY